VTPAVKRNSKDK